MVLVAIVAMLVKQLSVVHRFAAILLTHLWGSSEHGCVSNLAECYQWECGWSRLATEVADLPLESAAMLLV